jgi:hypothetical protein
VTLDEFATAALLSEAKDTDKIRAFAWYLLRVEERQSFTTGDIVRCFDALGMRRPSNTSQSIANMANRRPPEVIKNGAGFVLERRVREALDTLYAHRPSTAYVSKLLAELPSRLTDGAERVFLDEAIACLKANAFRAAIVMTWNLAFDHLCQFVLAQRLEDFNSALQRVFPKARVKVIINRAEFAEFSESEVLQICRTANITLGNVDKILRQSLETRNIAAHPSTEVFRNTTAEEFIRNLVENVVLVMR